MSQQQSFVRSIAILLYGSFGLIAIGVQSAMFGVLQRAGRVSLSETGFAASAEVVALALGVLLAGNLSKRIKPTAIAFAAAALLTLANLAMPTQAGAGVIALRILAGLGGGMMVWIANVHIVTSQNVVKLAAMFLIAQTFFQFSVAAGAAIGAPDNPNVIPLAMAGFGALALLLSPAARGLTTEPQLEEPGSTGGFKPDGMLAMVLMALLQLSLLGGWILVETAGAEAKLSLDVIAVATPLMLAAQLFGSYAAMASEKHLSWWKALAGVGIALALTQFLLGMTVDPKVFLALSFAYGLIWSFGLPQLTVMAIKSDPSLRVAKIGSAAILAGAAIGPVVATALAGQYSATTATMAFAVPSIAVLALALMLQARLARSISG